MEGAINKDYWDYDSLSLSVKSENVEDIVSSYGVFGWTEKERKADKQYSDIVNVDFVRNHNIPNKNKLQYLQVVFESLVNKHALLFSRRHYVSQAVLSVCIFTSVLLFVISFGLVFLLNILPFYVLAGLVFILDCAFTVTYIVKLRKLRVSESEKFEIKSKEIDGEIGKILASAVCLTGDKL